VKCRWGWLLHNFMIVNGLAVRQRRYMFYIIMQSSLLSLNVDHDLRSVVAAVTAKRVEDRTEDATKKAFAELNNTADNLVGPLESGADR